MCLYLENISKVLSKLHIFDFVAKFLLKFIDKRSLYTQYSKFSFKYIPFEKMRDKIDWGNTVAYSLPHSNPFNHIYINVKGRDPNGIVRSDEYNSIKQKIIKELLKLNKVTLNGKDIEVNKKINNAKLVDIAPTVLHMFSTPISDDLDGKVLKEIFKDESIFKLKKIVYSKFVDEKYRIKKKIYELRESGKI